MDAGSVGRVGQEVAALFTDITMPGSMDGLDLAKAVFERWPHILPVVTSGRERQRDADIPDGGRFIAKPYRLAEVLDTVRQSLASWPEARASAPGRRG